MNKNLLIVTLAIVAIVVGITFDIPLYIQAEQEKSYIYASEAIGVSMEPAINTGDLLIIEKKESPDFNVKIGDILIFEYEGKLVGHRLINIRDNVYCTKGDNNNGFEEIKEEQIIGKVIGIISRYNPIGQIVWRELYGQ